MAKKINVFGADWTCGICGHTNPAALEECQYCAHITKPEISSPVQPAEPKNPYSHNGFPIEGLEHKYYLWQEGFDACSAYYQNEIAYLKDKASFDVKFQDDCIDDLQAEIKALESRLASTELLTDALQHLHDTVDNLNSLYADKTQFCIVCHSKQLDGSGIVHKSDCVILEARKALAKMQKPGEGK